ncbi:MAG: 5'/3'-nucleotidase SurE [Gammaproteobacteria bacterium]|nr:5'/3'-nucleotidase SurE [Gammaproteobacteria bacterium]MBM4233904.1 5'/3'-nucleotidase SurE [Gammaproteobacteria bacterium]
MKILVSNDDGYRASGVIALRAALTGLAELTVVAPERNHSGASNALTLEQPLRVTEFGQNAYFVSGTPTDCVHLAISGLFDFDHDMVVSGINNGENLGDDALYSGTIAAAIEGRFLGLPTVAFSLRRPQDGEMDYGAAAKVARLIVERLLERPLERTMILNVNIPHRPFGELRGFKTTRLGHRHRAERAVKAMDPRGRVVYWVGMAGEGQDDGPGTDFNAVAEGYVSVTPLQVDLTRHAALGTVRDWLQGIGE